jgi:hypothetical protein
MLPGQKGGVHVLVLKTTSQIDAARCAGRGLKNQADIASPGAGPKLRIGEESAAAASRRFYSGRFKNPAHLSFAFQFVQLGEQTCGKDHLFKVIFIGLTRSRPRAGRQARRNGGKYSRGGKTFSHLYRRRLRGDGDWKSPDDLAYRVGRVVNNNRARTVLTSESTT